ncbi:MAG TPA: amino acid adenylation domain-containing protein, partial [Thermoanaerobaculia bacterium]|nr:amino acid adenylation domain-containing protein [Thermoanaerobaculia bacterium]
ERLRELLTDSGAAVLLTRYSLAGAFVGVRAEVIRLDTDAPVIERERPSRPVRRVAPESLAYVIYTSGSTGRPKAVEVSHSSLANLVGWHLRAYGVTPCDRATQVASLAFDASVWEVWPYLAAGASVHAAPEEARLSMPRLLGWLAEERITLLFLPTPLAEELLELAADAPEDLALRTLLVGGDRLRRAPERLLPFRVVNHYGPAEATVVSTWGPVETRERGRAERPPSIGRPVDNASAYVLGGAVEPMPLGASGELWIGGTGLARGYAGRPDLTAERFRPDPFAGRPGARFYRTGDLVRSLSSGDLEFVGRADRQVKVRGVRVEPAEVEAALLLCAGVRAAVVVPRQDLPGGLGLLGCVVPAAGTSLAEDALRQALSGRLPEPMVPRRFLFLESLPLTVNGKLDRRLLAELPLGEGEDLQTAPRTPVEEVLAGLFAEVLAVERIGVENGFFELGGHSLLATRLVSRVRSAFGVELPLSELFDHPTVAELARWLGVRSWRESVPVPPLEPVARGANLPLSFAQERLWFLHQLDPASPAYNIPLAVHLSGALCPEALAAALTEVTRRHETLRTTFRAVDGEARQIVSEPAPFAFPLIDLSALPSPRREAEIWNLEAGEARRPFDLSRGPLFRALLLRIATAEHRVLATFHHIVGDGWSLRVLLREVAAAYPAFRDGHPVPLPGLPVQYGDFAVWQRRWLAGSVLDDQLGYWTRRLAGAPPVLELPLEKPRPAIQRFRSATRVRVLPADLADAVRRLGRSSRTTVFMVVLAAWKVLLARYSGQLDLVVGAPIAGRTRGETEGLIGFFLNTLALRTDLSGDPEFAVILARVRKTTLDAYLHQDVPFERLLEELRPERDLSRTPVFQVMLNGLDFDSGQAEEVRLPGLAVELAPVGEPAARFDIEIYASSRASAIDLRLIYDRDLFSEAQ